MLRALRAARRRMEQGPISLEHVPAPPAAEIPPEASPAFDGAMAFALLERQCAFGPRAPGTDGHRRARGWLIDQLLATADAVALQRWKQRIGRGPGAGSTLEMTNLLAIVRGTDDADVPAERLRPEIMLSAHWDTRPVADQDPDPLKRALPVPGANDGASGVAVLLEAARALRADRPRRTVLFALWDGEDLGEYYYGSQAYARVCGRGEYAAWRAPRGILLDMVGKRDLRCVTEMNSLRQAPDLWGEVHDTAAALGLGDHFGGPAMPINDDHVFLSRAGIPTILLIDYDYPQWHTTADTPERCGPESLRVVGDVVLRFVRGGGSEPDLSTDPSVA